MTSFESSMEREHMSVSEMNEALVQVYRSAWQVVDKFPRDIGLSCPHFLKVHPNYLLSKHRIMVVGQEPYGWQPKGGNGLASDLGCDPLSTLLGVYEGFALAKHYRSTPFWRFAWELQNQLNGNQDEHAFLWSNLIKMNLDPSKGRTRLTSEHEEKLCNLRLLEREIEITKPDLVFFLSGPAYDERLLKTFPMMRLAASEGFKERELAYLVPSSVSNLSLMRAFRTYHPNYLQRSKARNNNLWARIMDALVARSTE